MDNPPPVVLVIGASNGIGRASALRFAERGAHVVLAARSEERLDVVAKECSAAGAATATAVPTDVLDDLALDRLFDRIDADHGHIDTVVHSPAVMAYGRLVDVPKEVFEQSVKTTIFGTMNVARRVLARFEARGQGTFVVVTSLLGNIAVPTMGTYATGKWAQVCLANTLALETRHLKNVHIATVSPGPVATPIYRRAANYIGREGKPLPPTYSAARVAGIIDRAVQKPKMTTQAGAFNLPTLFGFRFVRPLFDVLIWPLFSRAGLGRARIAPTEGNVFGPDSRPADADR